MSPERRAKTIKFMVVNMLRMFAAFLLVLGLKLKRDLRMEAQKKHEEMVLELEKLKEEGIG